MKVPTRWFSESSPPPSALCPHPACRGQQAAQPPRRKQPPGQGWTSCEVRGQHAARGSAGRWSEDRPSSVKVARAAEGGGCSASCVAVTDRRPLRCEAARCAPGPQGPWRRPSVSASASRAAVCSLLRSVSLARFAAFASCPRAHPLPWGPHPSLLGHLPFKGNDSFLM